MVFPEELIDPAGGRFRKAKAPAEFPPAPWRRHRLKGKSKADPGDAIISGFVGQHAAGVNEHTHMRIEAIFDAAASLANQFLSVSNWRPPPPKA